MYQYDLQAHSYFSDGDQSPEELVKQAAEEKLKGLILTDHNTTAGFETFAIACQVYNIETIPGVELTARYHGIEIHVLGYSREFNQKELNKITQPIINGYNERSREIVNKCRAAGLTNIDFDTLLAKRPRGTYVTKYDIVKELTRLTGQDKKEISKMFNAGGPLHVPYGDWALNPLMAIDKIHQANGVAVLAHPGDGEKRTTGRMADAAVIIDNLISEMTDAGLDGLEIRNSAHTPDDEKHYSEMANKYGLVITGGSDWHGPMHHPERSLGQAGLSEGEWIDFLSYVNKKTGTV